MPETVVDADGPLVKRVLIANRGEIAVRVIRACRDLRISPVAVYGPGEASAMHVRLADDAYRLDSESHLPYLDIPAVVVAATRAGCDAVHPGYGFLSENSQFAEACLEAALVFIGPSARSIEQMGDKIRARTIAQAAGVPVVPGSDGPLDGYPAAEAWAAAHGFPVAIKAAAGGGGRGFRIAHGADELPEAFEGSTGEASRYFANPVVYLERYLERPRHIEVQIFADTHGNAVWVGERDCSIQRRHQKLIEETPGPGISDRLRTALGEASIRLARSVDYSGAGTAEFMVTEDESFYFLEMNTRIQVEHTITEEVTGIDLVAEQIRVASGRPLSFSQADVCPRGHALQCRINAEDAGAGFRPVPGVLESVVVPAGPGVRVDTAMEAGAEVLPNYDSLIAKLVTWGGDRDESISRMRRALGEFHLVGVPTTIPFHQRVVDLPAFRAGELSTSFLDDHPEVLPPPALREADHKPASKHHPTSFVVEVDGRRLSVEIHGDPIAIEQSHRQTAGRPEFIAKRLRDGSGGRGHEIVSPLQGTVLRVRVEPGERVEEGDLICVIEAMKMENEIVAHRAGEITAVEVVPGSAVSMGSVLARFA